MIEKKNRVTLCIENCRQCPNATLKFNKEISEDEMFCQTETSCIWLREGWGDRPIPNWCPRLKQNQPKIMRGLRAKISGIIDDAMEVAK